MSVLEMKFLCTVILKPYQCDPTGKFSFVGKLDGCHTLELDLKGHTRLMLCMVSKIVQSFHMRSKDALVSSAVYAKVLDMKDQIMFHFLQSLHSHFCFLFAMTSLRSGWRIYCHSHSTATVLAQRYSASPTLQTSFHQLILPDLQVLSDRSVWAHFSSLWLLCSVCTAGLDCGSL